MTLEIVQYLKEQKTCKRAELIEVFHRMTGVEKEKILFRLEKMVKRNKLEIKGNGTYKYPCFKTS